MMTGVPAFLVPDPERDAVRLGVAGFLFRRNIITVFMSIELMLNAVNLSFVTFSYQLKQVDGHIFTLLRDGGGRGRSRRRPGDHPDGLQEPRHAGDRRRQLAEELNHACTSGSSPPSRWPASCVNGLFGRRAVEGRRQRRSPSARVLLSLPVGAEDARRRSAPLEAGLHRALLHLDSERRSEHRLRLRGRPPHRRHAAGGHRRRLAHPHLLHRLHGARGRLLPLLRLPEPVHVLHADPGAGAPTSCCCSSAGKAWACAATC